MPKNNFSPMMAALTKPKMPKMPQKAGRHFNTLASGGDIKGSKPFSNASIKPNPTILSSLMRNQMGGKLGM